MGEGCRRMGERTLELNLTFLLAPKDEKALMLQRFICTNKLLFQNAITCGMIKPTALEITLNSIKSSEIRVIIWGQGEKDAHSSYKGMEKKMI